MIRGFIFLISMIISIHAKAFNWSDLWQTPDQQAQNLMDKGQFSAATQLFERIDWAAAAAYKAGKYDKAAQGFAQLPTENGFYNQGNALAHLGKYEQAITAYDKALAINPANQDALYNRKLVEELLKQSQQNKDQQNKDQQNNDQQNKDQQNKDQQNKDQQNKDQQNKDQQNKDQQNKEQQNKDQQNKDQQNKDQQNKMNSSSPEDLEKQKANEQWLRLIPDDPGGLIREKFLRDHLRRQSGWYQ